MLERFTLQGWRGRLVFPDLSRYRDRNEAILCDRLHDVGSLQGKADWYRLLCLCCVLGTREVRTATIQTFWNRTLGTGGFWDSTIPETAKEARSSAFNRKLDHFFEELIHREFTSQNASGEEAELLRRVFYDFRKMHHFVFINDLPEVFLEVLEHSRNPDAPIRFLKSGHLPGQPAWRGIIGQSMTAPLLFLMRELARVGLIDRKIHQSHCYYMNKNARRAAVRLGWLEDRAISRYDFEAVLKASKEVHKMMSAQLPEGVDWFDLPLQVLGHK